MKGFSFFGMVHTFYNQKKPTLTARGEQLDASQGQNIALLQLIPTPSAGPTEHKGRVGICLHLFSIDMYPNIRD